MLNRYGLVREPILERLLWGAAEQRDDYPHVDLSGYHSDLSHYLGPSPSTSPGRCLPWSKSVADSNLLR